MVLPVWVLWAAQTESYIKSDFALFITFVTLDNPFRSFNTAIMVTKKPFAEWHFLRRWPF
ncbi:MAG: hypothetical protein CVV41_18050 [Candidatus Riflebacteria bacterium HGW-Riflebacteria-1]|nr:MAG: hypothetical protein CVV41_18050 [Candidatus Riflebacteria bacterium HGW-Riflebacteria-1]